MNVRLLILALASVLVCSCAKDGESGGFDQAFQGAEHKTIKEKFSNNYTPGQDSEGNAVMKSDKRSQFEKRSAAGVSRDFRGQDFTKKNYAGKRWRGNKNYSREAYRGDTDGSRFQHSPEFVQRQAKLKYARANGANYKTANYSQAGAQANRGRAIKRSGSQYAAYRQRNADSPEVLNNKSGRKMTVEETRSLLGN